MLRRFACALVASVMLLTPVATFAAPTAQETAEAKTYFDAGLAFYKAGRFSEALASFVEANRITPRESIQRNIAQTHRDLRDFASAHAAYEELLATYGASMKAADKANAERARDELATLTGQVSVTVPTTDAKVFIDGKEVGHPPISRRLNPGPHTVRVTMEGFAPLEQTIDIAGRDTITVAGPLVKPSQTGHVEVTVTPAAPAANVRVDGSDVGSAPWQGDLAPGSHRIEAESTAGAVTTTVDVTKGGKHAVALTLVAVPAAPLQPLPHEGPPAEAADPWRGLYTRVELVGLFAFNHRNSVEERKVYGASIEPDASGLYGGGVGVHVGYSLGDLGIEGLLQLHYDHQSVDVPVTPGRTDKWTFHRTGGTLGAAARWIPKLPGVIRPTAGFGLGLSGRTNGYTRVAEGTRDKISFEFYVTPTIILDGGVMIGKTPGGKLFLGLQMLIDLPSDHTLPSGVSKNGRYPIPNAATVVTATGPEIFFGPVLGLVLGH